MALPYQVIKSLAANGSIKTNGQINELQFQPASLDCTLGNKIYRVSSGFLPTKSNKALAIDAFVIPPEVRSNFILSYYQITKA